MCSPNERKMSMTMMSILFSKQTLSTSSVTGKRSKEGRTSLDGGKVQLIISEVLKKFPNASTTVIKAAMAQKCKDERNAIEARKNKSEH